MLKLFKKVSISVSVSVSLSFPATGLLTYSHPQGLDNNKERRIYDSFYNPKA